MLDTGWSRHRRRGMKVNRPIICRKKWDDIPGWIGLLAERGVARKCWNGCPLRLVRVHERGLVNGHRFGPCQIRGCVKKPRTGDRIFACMECRWAVCEQCNQRPRMPTLARDPLFHGPDEPCLISWPSVAPAIDTLGTVIICPGGNYEFLSPLEGRPVVEWLAKHGIGALVLRHRLLPRYCLDDCLDDLEAAARRVRNMRSGPVAALGFSAGGHLIASLALRAARRAVGSNSGGGAGRVGGRELQPLDAQVLVYPGIDARDWRHDEYHGFFNHGRWTPPKSVESLFVNQPALIDGEGPFGAPPTCLVASTEDTYCILSEHTDVYHRRLEVHGIPNSYICGPFGEHGFQLKGGWTPDCIDWLHRQGFGASPSDPTSSGAGQSNRSRAVKSTEETRTPNGDD